MVFAMTLVLTGLTNGFRVEAARTVDSLGIDTYLIKTGAAGPFIGSATFPAAELRAVARIPGVQIAVPLVYGSAIIQRGDSPQQANIFGASQRGPGMPAMMAGRAPGAPGELAVSDTLGRGLGDVIEIGSRTMRIVGLVKDSTALSGQPNVFLTVEGAQQLLFSGQPLISSIGIAGQPAHVPQGYRVVDRADAMNDMLRPLNGAYRAMSFMAVLLWVVAALIVGSLIYLSALERTRDFAVFKAVGVTTRAVLAGLALQAVLVAVISALFGGVLSLILGPLFPLRVVVPGSAFVLLPAVAVLIGLLASVAGLRRAVRVDPALAFGGP